jgi:hypothetical protein
MGSPRFLGSPCSRAVLSLTPVVSTSRALCASATLAELGLPRSLTTSATHDLDFEAQSHGPRARCLRFAAALADGLAQDSLPAGRIPSPGGFVPQDCS